MHFLAKIVLAILVNAAVLFLSAQYVPGIELVNDYRGIVLVAFALTALNFFLKPILKLILGPIIILTLGLGLLIVNALILYLLDFLSPEFTIQTTQALIYLTLITSAVNFVYHLATKK